MSAAAVALTPVVVSGIVKWLASAGVGYLSGLTAEIVKGRQDARDKAHELALLNIQLQFADKRASVAIAEAQAAGVAGVQADIDAARMAYEGPKPTGFKLIDFLNGSLRPAAGYAAIGAFCLFSTMLLVSMGIDIHSGGLTYLTAVQAFEGSLTADCVVAVWGFVFGARNFRAARSS